MRFETLDDWLAWQESSHRKKIDLGLSRVKRVFKALDSDRPLPYTVTVAGTNGKGSCVAYLDAILRAQGYRVGAYTSPHLLKYNERIRIDGVPAEDDSICAAFDRIDNARGEISLSYFEFGTLAALDIFMRAEVDFQILEVGLGGRLDAVNIIDANVALITNISIDHKNWLGGTRDAIGFEKAGILRGGLPAVVGDFDPPTSLMQHAEKLGARVFCIGRDFFYEKTANGWDWDCGDHQLCGLPIPAIAGEHQLQNASAVLKVLDLTSDQRTISNQAIRDGLAGVELPGRFQYIPGDVPVLLDVAHNPDATEKLAQHLRLYYADCTIHAVFSIMRDKDIRGVVSQLKSLVKSWYIAPLKIPRAAGEARIAEVFDECSISAYFTGFSGFEVAFNEARKNAGKDHLILVFGSFYLVAEYLAMNSDC